MTVDTRRLRWFADSPDAGPDCICSLCGEPIWELPLSLFDEETGLEARLHTECWNQVSPDKITLLDDYDDYEDRLTAYQLEYETSGRGFGQGVTTGRNTRTGGKLWY